MCKHAEKASEYTALSEAYAIQVQERWEDQPAATAGTDRLPACLHLTNLPDMLISTTVHVSQQTTPLINKGMHYEQCRATQA